MYSTFYNLTKKPFQLNPDPEFFFNSAVHKRGLAYLRYGLEQGEGFIVVTGAPGTGKTMLVKELFETIHKEEVIPGLMVTSQIGADDALRMVAASYDLPFDGIPKAVLLKSLEGFFKMKAQEGKRVLLVVDEAQHLPYQSLEELRMLLNLEFNGKPLLQIFMLGQDELRCLLQADNMEQVRQRITATYHLRALEKEETKDYILHRLITAGWNKNPNFSEEIFDDIYQFTGGTPRIINNLCDRLLLYGFLEELNVLDRQAATIVINEIEQDSKYQKADLAVDNTIYTPTENHDIELSPNKSPEFELRLTQLENQIKYLINEVNKEKVLLRKAILINLDMSNIYDNHPN